MKDDGSGLKKKKMRFSERGEGRDGLSLGFYSTVGPGSGDKTD